MYVKYPIKERLDCPCILIIPLLVEPLQRILLGEDRSKPDRFIVHHLFQSLNTMNLDLLFQNKKPNMNEGIVNSVNPQLPKQM